MDNYKKFGLIAAQAYTGLGFAIFGVVAQLIVVHIISVRRGIHMDTFGTIMGSWIGVFFGFLIGSNLVGYYYLKKNGRQNNFLKYIVISVFGTTIGFYGAYQIMMNSNAIILPDLLIILLAYTLPLIGTILSTIIVLANSEN